MKRLRLKRNGFTLIEVMIVACIVGALASLVIPNYFAARNTAMRNRCLANIKQMQDALEIAAFDIGTSTTNLNAAGIQAIVVPDYIRTMPSCPYGNYSTDGDGIVHCSEHAPAGG